MSQYSEILDRITLDLLNRPELRTEAARAVRSAIRQYEARRFWFNETATALATSSGSNLAPPSDLLSLDRLEITENSTDTELVKLDFDTLRDLQASRPSGRPTHFAYYADTFSFFPIPDSAYQINCYYIHSLPTLSADTDTNGWTTFGENLIVHTAASDLLGGLLQNHGPKLQYHLGMAAAGMRELSQHNEQRLLRRIKATKF